MVCLNAFHHRVLFFFDVSFTQRILMSASDVRIFVCIYIVIQRASFLVISLTFVSSFGSASMNFHNMKLMKVSSCHITAHALKFAHKSLKSVQFSIFLQYIAHTFRPYSAYSSTLTCLPLKFPPHCQCGHSYTCARFTNSATKSLWKNVLEVVLSHGCILSRM
jgi:hypothetical protein